VASRISLYIDDNCFQETTEQKDKTIHYIKLHVPWKALSANAELLLLHAPLMVEMSDFIKFKRFLLLCTGMVATF